MKFREKGVFLATMAEIATGDEVRWLRSFGFLRYLAARRCIKLVAVEGGGEVARHHARTSVGQNARDREHLSKSVLHYRKLTGSQIEE